MDNSKISVVVITYNAERFISDCLNSLLEQTLRPYEIIVCDDASTDHTRDIITDYIETYRELFRPIFHPANQGIAKNINSGLKAAQGDYVSLIAGDDGWYPDKLRLEIERLWTTSEARWVYSGVDFADESGKSTGPFKRTFDGCEGDILFPMLCHEMTLHNWLAELDLCREVGFYDDSFAIYEDWDYKIRLAATAPIAYVASATGWYRRHNSGASKSHWSMHLQNLNEVYRKHQSLISSLPSDQQEQVVDKKQRDFSYFIRQMKKEVLETGEIPINTQFGDIFRLVVGELIRDQMELGQRNQRYTDQIHQQSEHLKRLIERTNRQAKYLEQYDEHLKRYDECLKQLEQLAVENKNLHMKLDLIQTSLSWKITAPLRKLSRSLNGLISSK